MGITKKEATLSSDQKYYFFFLWTALLTVPFYVLGYLYPHAGPAGIPLSFLGICIPLALAIVYAYREGRWSSVGRMFAGILDARKAWPVTLAFSTLGVPLVALLAYKTAMLSPNGLPEHPAVAWAQVPIMFLLYALGAIAEEVGWTSTLTPALVRRHGKWAAGAMIGLFWGLWHVFPWSLSHPLPWVAGMLVFDVVARLFIVHNWTQKGSLLTAVLTHAMVNVCMFAFPNEGSHMNPWVFAFWMALLLTVQLGVEWRLRNPIDKPQS